MARPCAACGYPAAPEATGCPRCAMPLDASEEQLRAYRAHGEAIRAMGPRWPYAVSPAYLATLEAALRAGVPRPALRRLFRAIQEEVRHRMLEALAARAERDPGALPPDWLGEVVM